MEERLDSGCGEAVLRKQFTFYRAYYDALLPLAPDERAEILLAVCAYALDGRSPEHLTPVGQTVFSLLRPALEHGRKKADSGARGGAHRGSPGSPAPAAGVPDPAEDGTLLLPLKGGASYPVRPEELEQWGRLYPEAELLQEFRSMRGWLLSNPARRKTRSGIARFISNWLQRAQKEHEPGPYAVHSAQISPLGKAAIRQLLAENAPRAEEPSASRAPL
jgi:hypothetical protein